MGAAEDLERLRKGREKKPTSRTTATKKSAAKVNLDDYIDGGSGDSGGGDGKSLWGQAGQVFSALPAGLAQLGAKTWDSTVGSVGSVFATAAGASGDDIRDDNFLSRMLINESLLDSARRGDSFRDQFKAAAPILDEVGQSFSNTGGRLVDLASVPFGDQGLGDTKYAQAVDESGIVGTLLEDVGNLALGGAAAGQSVGGASRGLAASRSGAPLVGKTAGPAGPSVWRAANSPHGNPVRGVNGRLPTAGRVGAAGERVGQLGYGLDQALGKALFSPLRIPGTASRLVTGEGMTPRARLRTGKGVGQVIGETDRYKEFRDQNPIMQKLDQAQLTPRSRGVRDVIADESHRRDAHFATVIDSARESITRITDSPVEGVAARLRTMGVADALAPFGKLPDSVRRKWIDAITKGDDGQGALIDMTPEDATQAFDLAIRSVADPDTLDAGQLGRLEQAQEAWRPVSDLQQKLYEDQYGVFDPRSPEAVALLSGDEVLPFETARVMEGYAKEREGLTKEQARLEGRVERARGKVKLDDELIDTKGAGLAARGRELDSTAVKLIDSEGGPEFMAELLDPDNKTGWASMDEARLASWVRGQVRDRLNGRAAMIEQGMDLPGDIFSDAVESSGLKSLPIEPSQKGRAKVRSEVSKEAVAKQARQDFDRLGRRVETVDAATDRLAGALESAVDRRVQQGSRASKIKGAVRDELRADANVRSAASAYTKLKNKVRDGEILSEKALTDTFQDIRKAALPLLDDVADNQWVRLEDEYGIRDTVVLGDTHVDHAVAVVEAVAQRTGLDVEQVLNYGPGGRKGSAPYLSLTDPDTGRAFARVVDGEVRAIEAEQVGVFGPVGRGSSSGLEVVAGGLEARGLTDGSVDAAMQRVIDDVSEIINANEMRRWIKGTRSSTQKGGVRRAQATQGGMRAYLSSERGIDMLDSVLSAMDDDPSLVYAAFSDDPVAAVREITVEQFDEGWASVPAEASRAAAGALRAADEAVGPGRILGEGENPAGSVVADARAEFVSGFDNAEVAGAAFDAAFGRLQQTLARKVTDHAVSTDPGVRAATRRVAREAGTAGRRLGRIEGESGALQRERGVVERRADRGDTADVEGAEYAAGLEQGERGGRFMLAQGQRLAPLKLEQAHLAKVNRRIANLDAQLADDLAKAREKIESAPANYRTALSVTRQLSELAGDVAESITDPATAKLMDEVQAEIVTTVVDALDVLDPTYVLGGRLPLEGAPGGQAGFIRKTSSEYLKEGELSPLSDGAQMVMVSRSLELLARNEIVKKLWGRHGRTAASLLGDDVADGLSGASLLEAVNAASDIQMVAVNPRSKFAHMEPNHIRPDTVLMPRWVVDSLESQFGKVGDAERMARILIDKPTRLWKHGVLALSPRWHMGNIVGNTLMAWAAGIPPHMMLAHAREARDLMREGLHWRLAGSGSGVEVQKMMQTVGDLAGTEGLGSRSLNKTMLKEVTRGAKPGQRQLLRGKDRAAGAAQRGVDRAFDPNSRLGRGAGKFVRGVDSVAEGMLTPIQSSYNLNGWVDDFFHAIVYLDEMKKGASPEAAVRQSLKVAGDFSTMTKFERSFIRRAMPFYSWMRHITRLSADLAVNHPARVAWNLHLWTLFNEQEDLSDIPWMAGSIQTGENQYVNAQSYMPFGTVLDFNPADPLGTLASSTSPVFKMPLEIGAGIEAGPGGLEKMSSPEGYGERALKPIGIDPTFHRLSRLTPQTRALAEILRGPDERTVRYDTGESIAVDGRRLPDVDKQSNRDVILRSLLGLPLPRTVNPDAVRAQQRSG